MFWIMLLDVKEARSGDYRTLSWPWRTSKQVKTFYWLHRFRIRSVLIYWCCFYFTKVFPSLALPSAHLCLKRPHENVEKCLSRKEAAGAAWATILICFFIHTPAYFPHCHSGFGLVDWWFSANSSGATWELVKNASFGVPYHINRMRNSRGSREDWTSVHSDTKYSTISYWAIQPNVWKTWWNHHQENNCGSWQNSLPGSVYCSKWLTYLDLECLLFLIYAERTNSS